ncbi:hypothetical protein EWM64_g4093 [Hericium alpestre]|uniref:XPG N-terminal domain-containing protein n=1 Tax=Hericium alpestre TaxID=135208 RepID=A0A4Z0A235_9AGAM|nr:hypothetical protein EWM64_g4093 [Hericium alpestre]
MGISGLLPLLKSIQVQKHLSEFAGQTLAVDGYVWLHRGTYACATELATGKSTSKYVEYAMQKVRLLRHHGIHPYLVFDGGPLPAKRGTEKERQQRRADNLARGHALAAQGRHKEAREFYCKCVDVTPQMAYQLIKALKAAGVPYLVAPYEADAQLAYLERSYSPSRSRSRSRSRDRDRERDGRRRARSYSPSRSRSRDRDRRREKRRRSRSSERSVSSDEERRHKRRKEKYRSRSRDRKERKKEKKDKKKSKKSGVVGGEWGKFGIISETDLYSKEQEFRAWLVEERMMNPETMSKDQTKKEFLKFVEDFNTATLPNEKFYNMTAYDTRMAAMRAGAYVPPAEDSYDPNADIKAHALKHKRPEQERESYMSREQLMELRKVQQERIEAGKMKLLGMDIKQNMGVRMDGSKFDD